MCSKVAPVVHLSPPFLGIGSPKGSPLCSSINQTIIKMKESESQNLSEIVMPSLFKSLKAKTSSPLLSWTELARYITCDSSLKGLTDSYRQRLTISKDFANQVKWMSPAISIAVQFKSNGRMLEDVSKETGYLMLDIDELSPEQVEEKFSKAIKAAYTQVCYRTISGHGLRIFMKYERPKNCELSMVDLYNVMLHKAIVFYELSLDVKVDRQCSDFTRLSGLAHDPKAYFNWTSIPLTLSEEDMLDAEKHAKKPRSRKLGTRKSPSGSSKQKKQAIPEGVPTLQEAETHILQLLDSWGCAFESGNHNRYMVEFANACLKYGIAYDEICQYANEHFCQDYPEALSVVKSCYKHTERMGIWHFYREGETMPYHPTVKRIKQWLSCHYEFQRNLVTGGYEVKSRQIENAKFLKWKELDEDDFHSIWAAMDEAGIHISVKKLSDIVQSDFSARFDPFKSYLESLSPWDGETDYIAELANRVTIEDRPGYHHTQAKFVYYFRKWFVGMVVGWIQPQVVNQTVLIFVGKGGIYKTSFFAHLLPPILRQYFLNESTYNYTDKDTQESYSSKALICIDEYEAAYGKNSSALKSNVTKQRFSIRRPYDKFRSELVHRSALSATSNSIQIIADEENRRFSPWIVTKIISPIEHPFNYEGLYAQAVALGKQVSDNLKAGKQNEWIYWLTPDDIEEMRTHNRLFMVTNFAEEQILRLYRVPDEDTDKALIKFRYNAEILERICTNPVMRQSMSTQNIGALMARLGFRKAHRKKGNGWWVVELEGSELLINSKFNYSSDNFE